MRQRHAEIVFNPPRTVELIKDLVQSTDQSFHLFFLFIAALVIAA